MSKSAKKREPKPAAARLKTVKLTQAASVDPKQKTDAGSKQARVIAMLRSPTGTTIAAMMKETDWQQHSVRGFLAGVVRKKLKFKVLSEKVDGARIYRIDSADRVKASGRSSKARTA